MSNIIATVLLVLLGIAAIAIIWAFVSGSIFGSTGQIKLNTELRKSTFSILSARILPTGEYSVVVQRGPGGSEEDRFSYFPVLVFEDSDGNLESVNLQDDSRCNSLAELAACTYATNLDSLDLEDVARVSVYPAIADEEGHVANAKNPTDVEEFVAAGADICVDGDGECPAECLDEGDSDCTFCGDGSIQNPNDYGQHEQCEGDLFGSYDGSCVNYNSIEYVSGSLACSSCIIDASSCQSVQRQCNNGVDDDGDGLIDLSDLGCANAVDDSEANCGDSVVQIINGEACDDGAIVGGDGCSASCQYECGDGLIDGNGSDGYSEECDGDSFGSATCQDRGFGGGNLECTNVCTIDTSHCISTPPIYACNDGIDNDGDGLVDLSDPGCSVGSDQDENNCGDGIVQVESGEQCEQSVTFSGSCVVQGLVEGENGIHYCSDSCVWGPCIPNDAPPPEDTGDPKGNGGSDDGPIG